MSLLSPLPLPLVKFTKKKKRKEELVRDWNDDDVH